MTQPYDNTNVNSGDSIFQDVFVYGKFNYDFSGDSPIFDNVYIKNNLYVGGLSTHVGVATFKDDVFIDGDLSVLGEFNVDYLTVFQRFDVGAAGTVFTAISTSTEYTTGNRVGIGTTQPMEYFQIGDTNNLDFSPIVVTGVGTVGLGTTNPGFGITSFNNGGQGTLSADVETISIRRNIYDSAGSHGANGAFMNRDATGIRWVTFEPAFSEGIFVQDEGTYIPIVGAAQSFTVLNFTQINSDGIGTDTMLPIPDPGNPLEIARLQSKDLWGYTTAGDANSPIYRRTKVGIHNDNPTKELDVTGELHVTGDVDFDSDLNVDGNVKIDVTLDVDGATTLNNTLDVDGKATFNNTDDSTSPTDSSSVQIDGGVGIVKRLNVGGAVDFDTTLNVDGDTTLNATLDVDGATTLNNTLDVDGATTLNLTLDVDGATTLNNTLDVDGIATFNNVLDASSTTNASVQIDGGVGIVKKLIVGDQLKVESTLVSTSCTTGAAVVTGGVGVGGTVYICGDAIVEGTTQSNDKDTGSIVTEGGVGIEKNLNVGENTKLIGTLELEDSIIDKLNSAGYDVSRLKNDYRLSAVGAGVSWRPSGVETENAVWVTVDGDDSNTGLLEGDAKRTIGAAAAVAREGDTIIIRSGSYTENNPIGLRTDVTVTGEDLRLVTIIPQNRVKDVFHVRRGCLIQNLNFSGPPTDGQGGVSIAHTDAGAVAFPPTSDAVSAGTDFQAVTGYTAFGPADEGVTGRWRSPYIRNCTNFMSESIGMKINGDFANANFSGTNNLGQDLKSMVCDSFTQYNENGIGVSLSNNAYAQLVSIFTIASDIGISCVTGGQCDLTNSNSSFGNVGLKADGVGATEFTGLTFSNVVAESDIFPVTNLRDTLGNFRKPFDGQGLFFKINLADYNDTPATGVLTEPMKLIRSINVVDGGLPGDYIAGAPPIVTVPNPLGPEAIAAEFSANVSAAGTITSVDVISSGRNFLPDQSFTVSITGTGNAVLEVDTDPILFTVSVATEPTSVGLTSITFNEFVPYAVNAGVDIELVRISRIITSSHSFEYIGAGTDINKANPFQGGVPKPENEVIAINGGQCPFTSTDQKGNFRIGQGLVVDQTTSTIRGRDFNRAIQAQLTPLILALR
jgi:hypothetical protein